MKPVTIVASGVALDSHLKMLCKKNIIADILAVHKRHPGRKCNTIRQVKHCSGPRNNDRVDVLDLVVAAFYYGRPSYLI